MTIIDESISCIALLHGKDSRLAAVEFKLSSASQISFELMDIDFRRNAHTFADQRSRIIRVPELTRAKQTSFYFILVQRNWQFLIENLNNIYPVFLCVSRTTAPDTLCKSWQCHVLMKHKCLKMLSKKALWLDHCVANF